MGDNYSMKTQTTVYQSPTLRDQLKACTDRIVDCGVKSGLSVRDLLALSKAVNSGKIKPTYLVNDSAWARKWCHENV